MKKIILWLLTFSVAASNLTAIAFAETENEYEPYVRSIDFLNGIGLTDIDIQSCESEVTRGETVNYVYKILNNPAKSNETVGVFTDVTAETQYADVIEDMARKGIIHGYSDGSYQPEKPATVIDAIYMLIYVMGLQYEAEFYGNNEAAFMRVANDNGLLDKTKEKSGFLSVGDMAVMMYNALHGSVGEMSISYGVKQYEKNDKTLLYQNFNIVYDEGIIIKNDITSLWSATDINKEMIEISTSRGNIEINAAGSDVWQDIGKRVRVYYYADDDLKYVYHEIHKNSSELTIDFNNLDFDGTDINECKISYVDSANERTVTKKLSQDFSLLYNNMYYAEAALNLDECKGCAGNITLIDNNGDNKYEVVSIKKYDTLFVDEINESNNLIFDRTDKNVSISTNEDDYEKIIVKDMEGAEAQFSDITVGSVISVAKSSENTKEKSIEIIICTDFVTGKITKINNDDYTKIVLDDISEYDVLKSISTQGLLGVTVSAYLDSFGNVAYISVLSGRDWQYGICIKKKYDFGKEKITLRIIAADGNIAEYQLADNVRIDEEKYKNMDVANRTLSNVTQLNVNVETRNAFVMRYKLDKEDNITSIDTVNKGEEKTDNYLTLIGNGTFVNCSGSVLGWRIPFESDARVISISARDYSDSKNFQDSNSVKAGTAAGLIRNAGTAYSVAAFKSNDESSKADFIVHYKTNKLEYGTPLFVIKQIVDGYNEDLEEVMPCVIGYVSGQEKKYWIGSEDKEKFMTSGYAKGDVIRCVTDVNDKIILWENISKYSSDKTEYTLKNVEGGGLSVSGGTSVTIQDGFVYKKDGSLLIVNNSPFGTNRAEPSEIDLKNQASYYINVSQSATVTVVDFSENKVFTGNVDDIRDYIHQVNDCSRILTRWRSNSLSEIVIFNR